MSAQDAKAVTIVTQTRLQSGKDAAFAEWQQRMSAAVAAQAGFVKETVIPPSPPAQIDWVILQRFASRGGIIRFVTDHNRIRLRINLDAARAARLTLSSKLLRPAQIVPAGKD